MYIPKHFEVDELEVLTSFIEANAFGQLITQVDGRLFSSHLPIMLSDDRKTLFAHIARANSQHKTIEGQEVLLSFSGPHDYISPSWYASSGVPTWNYQAVHVYGECRTFDDPARLKLMVDQLTHKYEVAYENPWQPDYPASMVRGIIGLEISISDIQGQYKLSQNRSEQDRRRVIEQLELNGSRELAKAMRKNKVPCN